MANNLIKIQNGIRSLSHRPREIISGTVVPGSVDTGALTMSVQPNDSGDAIEGVLLSAVSSDTNGIVLIPASGSSVVIGSIDGSGLWTLVKASELAKVIVTIGNVICEADSSQVNIKNGDVVLNMSDTVFKLNTASESLYHLLKDCFTYITALTVTTSTGTSSTPDNITDFSNLIARIDNLLSS